MKSSIPPTDLKPIRGLIVGFAAARQNPTARLSSFKLAHLSDPHLPPPPGALGLRDLASKRGLSRIAWRRKRREHQPAILAAIVEDLRAQAPDHVAVTGDLTNFAAPAEYAAAQAWLTSLGSPHDVTVSPGNHDALAGPESGRFAPWAAWLGDEPEIAFPASRERGGIAVINVCSAVATAPHLATGRLGEAQLASLEAQLKTLAARGLFRVILIHHPPAPGVVSARKALEDGEALRAVLARQGAELILHGHGHEAVTTRLPGPSGAIPVLGAPSASAAGHGRHPPARWNLIEIDPGDRAAPIRVQARGLAPSGRIEPLGAFRLSGRSAS